MDNISMAEKVKEELLRNEVIPENLKNDILARLAEDLQSIRD